MNNNTFKRLPNGLFLSPDGREHVRCRWKTQDPVMIDVSGSIWSVRHLGILHTLPWERYAFSTTFLEACQSLLKRKLQKHSPSYLGLARTFLNTLNKHAAMLQQDFSALSLAETHSLMAKLPIDKQSVFRTWYEDWARHNEAGAKSIVAKSLQDVRITRDAPNWMRSDNGILRKAP